MNDEKIFQENLLDLTEGEILNQTEEDLLKMYGVNSIEDLDDFKSTKLLIDNALTQHKKNRLISARENLELVRQSSSNFIIH